MGTKKRGWIMVGGEENRCIYETGGGGYRTEIIEKGWSYMRLHVGFDKERDTWLDTGLYREITLRLNKRHSNETGSWKLE